MVNKDLKEHVAGSGWKYIYPVILVLAVFIQYKQTLDYGFVWDDKIVIQENPRVKNGLRAIPDLFTKFKSPYRHDQYGYRPVTLVSFALEIEFWGVNPYYHHLMNLLYYALLCLLIFFFLSKIFKEYHPVFSFLITLIFTVHPLHVEVVANIKSRDEILAMLFSILSLTAYIQFLKLKKVWFYVASIFWYLLAFLSKENAVTTLLLYPLIYIFEFKSDWQRRIKNLFFNNIHVILLIILSVIIFQLAESSQLGKNEVIERNIVKEDDILGNSLFHTDGMLNKLPTVFFILLLYFKLFIIPYPLVFYYGYNQIPVKGWIDLNVWIAILFFVGLIYILIRFRKTHPELWFGGAFFIFTISIYLHIIRKLSDTMADRFMFMPSLGLAVMLVGFVGMILKHSWKLIPLDKKKKRNTHLLFNTTLGINIVIAIIFMILSHKRTGVWKDDKTLVFTDMKNLENCSRVHYYYANILWNDIKNNPRLKPKLEKEMIHHYRRSVEIAPDYVYYARMELGKYFISVGKYVDALELFTEIDKLFPNRAPVLFNIGESYLNLGKYNEAIEFLIRAKELAPHYSTIPFLLTIAESKLGHYDKAIEIANQAMEDFPAEKRIYIDALTTVYAEMKDKDRFIEHNLQLLNFGANPNIIYNRIIKQLEQWGMKEETENYRLEAKRRGIILQ